MMSKPEWGRRRMDNQPYPKTRDKDVLPTGLTQVTPLKETRISVGELVRILAELRRKSITGKYTLTGGNCGKFAVALNNVLGGEGEYYAIVEEYEPEYFSHVVLKWNGKFWDAKGEISGEDLKDYGYNPEHPDQEIDIIKIDEGSVLKFTGSMFATEVDVNEIESMITEEILD